MRPSPLKHPLAVLRVEIGLTQKEVANLVGRAARTIQAVELGQLPLSEDLAMLIGQATGVDAGWLLENDPEEPPRKGLTALGLARGKGIYRRADFEVHRAFVESPTASQEELEATAKAATRTKQKLITMAIPVAKAALLEQKKKMLKIFDQQTLEALQDILSKTQGTETGDLIRWKTRRFLKTLSEEYNMKLDLTNTASTAIAHLHIEEAKEKSSRRVTKI